MQRCIDVTIVACVKSMLIKIAATQHRDFRAAELQQKIKVMPRKVLDFIDEQFIVVTGKPGTDRGSPPTATPALAAGVAGAAFTARRLDDER